MPRCSPLSRRKFIAEQEDHPKLTDWILLHDTVRALMKAIALIRRAGLRHRIRPIGKFRAEEARLKSLSDLEH